MGKIDGLKALRLQAIGCIACRKEGYEGVPSDLHHPTSGGRRLDDALVIPLCSGHHRAVGNWIGPSLAHGRKPFEARYGTEQELLEETERLLRELYDIPPG